MGFLQPHVGYGGRHGKTRLIKQTPARTPGRKAIEVESPEQAAAAIKAAAALERPVLLMSAEHASASAGPAWFAHLVENARVTSPGCDVVAMLDCGDSPGHALAALREGLRAIRFNGPTFDKIADIAGQYDALCYEKRPASLALKTYRQDEETLEKVCRNWLKD
jgi:hypothetical protein